MSRNAVLCGNELKAHLTEHGPNITCTECDALSKAEQRIS